MIITAILVIIELSPQHPGTGVWKDIVGWKKLSQEPINQSTKYGPKFTRDKNRSMTRVTTFSKLNFSFDIEENGDNNNEHIKVSLSFYLQSNNQGHI